MALSLFALAKLAAMQVVGTAAAESSQVPWVPGHVCPAGGWWDNPSKSYGDEGFEWVGHVVAEWSGIGNPSSCCQNAGGNGLRTVGKFYTLCNPRLGCTGKPYTCTIFDHVTGKRKMPGAVSGIAQKQVEMASTTPALSPQGPSYGNPFSGKCRSNAAGHNEINATIPSWGMIPGAVCAPFCGPSHQSCPTDVPTGTTATPQCLLFKGSVEASGNRQSACGLVCDASGNSTKCPEGATCKSLYNSFARSEGVLDTGICTYDGPTAKKQVIV